MQTREASDQFAYIRELVEDNFSQAIGNKLWLDKLTDAEINKLRVACDYLEGAVRNLSDELS